MYVVIVENGNDDKCLGVDVDVGTVGVIVVW